MSRYLQHLVMRSQGELSGLSPRPATRYEFAGQNVVTEFAESMQERSFQDRSSWTLPSETDISRAEGIREQSRQTGASLPSESVREAIGQKRQDQLEIFDGKSDDDEINKMTQADPGRSTHDVSQEGAVELLSSAPRQDTALSDGRESRATPIARRSEALPVMRSRETQSAAVKGHPPSVRRQDVVTDSLRPTLNEVSFQSAPGGMIAPPTEARTPIVQIRIGRIEVRAVEPSVPAPNKKLVEPPRSSVSLDQYLRRRSQES